MKNKILHAVRLLMVLIIVSWATVGAIQPQSAVAQGSELDATLARATVKGYLISLKRGSSGSSVLTGFYLTDDAANSSTAEFLSGIEVDTFEVTGEERLQDGVYQVTASISPDDLTLSAAVSKVTTRWQITDLTLIGGGPAEAEAPVEASTEAPAEATTEASTEASAAASSAAAVDAATDTPSSTDAATSDAGESAAMASEAGAVDATSNEEAATASPSTPATPVKAIPVDAGATAEVLSSALSIRNGPGFEYDTVGYLAQGNIVDIVGSDDIQRWYQVARDGEVIGWISGKSDYVAVSGQVMLHNDGMAATEEMSETSAAATEETATEAAVTAETTTTEAVTAETATATTSDSSDGAMVTSGDATATVVVPSLAIRGGPGTDYISLGVLNQGDVVDVIGVHISGIWYQVARNGQFIGWIGARDQYVTSSPGTADVPVVLGPDDTSYDDTASTTPSTDTASPSSDTPAEAASETNAAERAATAASDGSATATVVAGALNIRAGPGLEYGSVGRLDNGEVVDVVGVHPSRIWYQIARGGQVIGWIGARTKYVTSSPGTADVPIIDGPDLPESSSKTTNAPIVTGPPASSGGNNILLQESPGSDIYLTNINGTTLNRITAGVDPTFSPDGTKIAFTRWDSGSSGSVWIYDLNTGNEWKVVDSTLQAKSPTWSPDGSKLIVSFQHGGRRSVEEKCGRRGKIEIPPGAYDIQVGSESGNICFKLPADSEWKLREIDIASQTYKDLASDNYSFAPTWDPANDWRVVFVAEKGMQQLDLNRNEFFTFTDDVRDRGPVFSPDGSMVAVTYRQHDHWEVYTISTADGSRNRITKVDVLADRSFNSAAPAWSPDGSQIIFLTDRNNEVWEYWIMNADGSNPRPFLSSQVASQLTPVYNGVDERLVSWGR